MDSTAPLHVEFDYTLEEMLDVSLRSLKLSKTHQQLRLRGLSITWIGTFSILYLIFNYETLQRIIAAASYATATLFVYWLLEKYLLKQRLMKYYNEKNDEPWPIHIAVELNERGVLAIQKDLRTEVEWPAFEKVILQNGDLELYSRKGGLTVIRSRAFTTDAQRNDFLNFAEQHIKNLPKESE